MRHLNLHLVPETDQVVRPVVVSVAAIGVLVLLMVGYGWNPMAMLLAGCAMLIGAVLALQVWWSVSRSKRQETTVRESAMETEQHVVDVLLRIVRFVEARSPFALGRSQRVGRLSQAIGRKMGLSETTCSLLNLAGQLQDVGMMAVPESVLSKRAALGGREFRTIQRHSQVSYEMLRPLKSLAAILPGVRHHHERMNGTGYPSRLSGTQIPIEARILAVADAYDAMTHDRPHRPAVSALAAMDELMRCTPAGFDPQCVEALADLMHHEDLLQVLSVPVEAPADEEEFVPVLLHSA